jgi:hypothetical protein
LGASGLGATTVSVAGALVSWPVASVTVTE